jgi:hypothetical protein
MEDTQATEVATEEIKNTEEKTEKKVPKARTEAQKSALDRARVRAMEVRAANAELKRKEAELSKVQAVKRVEKINSEYADISKKEPETPRVSPKKRKAARRVIVTEVSSASDDDDVEIVLPRPKVLKPPTAAQISYQRTAIKMFAYD